MPLLSDVDDNTADYSNMSAKELKEACRSKGLKVSGNKTTLRERLSNPEASLAAKKRAKRGMSVDQVHAALKDIGFRNPEGASSCIKKAIQKGHISLNSGSTSLDTVIFKGDCLGCGTSLPCTLGDALRQSDYGGNDYEDGAENGAMQCEECDMGAYVTGFCEGQPATDSGKFHNHCTSCPGFGKCIGDYREAHCNRCNKHFFAGLSGFSCPQCSGGGGGRGGGDFGFW